MANLNSEFASSIRSALPRSANVPGDSNSVAARYARAKALKDAEEEKRMRKMMAENGVAKTQPKQKTAMERLNGLKAAKFKTEWTWALAFFVWLFLIHATGIYFFTKGFLLTRLVLEEKSSCDDPPVAPISRFTGLGTSVTGCWHPKSFDKAVIVIIDALRYDFTIPYLNSTPQAYHNGLPFLYDTAVKEPNNAFLLPFIADPPTATLQRIKGLTTGTLPTFVDAGSNFAGTAIEEDNLLMQMKDSGKKIVHLGDDTWTALFPGYFEQEISRPYDSFNVWDLHTLDNGVTEHIMPLLERERRGEWDVMIAHFLGVDHAGHRYGPNHPAMTAKLAQMDRVLRDIASKVDDNTLLVVMGDHGMDAKGDHGGESDDEVQAALWMYSKRGIFGRTNPAFTMPPQTAKERPVNQIDLVPTLALLLGLPIPFNNLGKPIEEAFVGKKGNSWDNLAAVARMTAAGIKRYQAAYYVARGINETGINSVPYTLWSAAETSMVGKPAWQDVYGSFSAFSTETLKICRDLWARFDVPCMTLGICILAAGLIALMLFANGNSEEKEAVDNPEADRKELQLELDNIDSGSISAEKDETTSRTLVRGALLGTLLGTAAGPAVWIVLGANSILDFAVSLTAISGLLGVLYQDMRRRMAFSNPLPRDVWSWLAVIFTISQSIGFASNSYTIWEDSILLFFLSTFGIVATISSSKLESLPNRTLGTYHSLMFIVLGWAASFSKLCREEQMPYCRSTYYSSANSSTSALWQLLIPFVVAIFLPAIIKSFYTGSRSYEGFAPVWIGWVFRLGLVLSAIFWTLDAADDGEWISSLGDKTLKSIRTPIAQIIFAAAIVSGCFGFAYAPPCVSINTTSSSAAGSQKTNGSGATVTILGFANTHGTRYFLLVTNILLCTLLVQKPMGAGALAIMAWQILSLVEILDLNTLTTSPIGPVILAILGSFHFFKTGHQATLSSIQWETAFIPLHTIRYPWSPLLVTLNSYGAQILAAAALPLIVFWKQKPRKKLLLKNLVTALAWHIAYYAVVGLATTIWAAWLRRHLMLYRIFSPKFMTAAVALVLVDVIGIVVALVGSRFNMMSVGEIFGWG